MMFGMVLLRAQAARVERKDGDVGGHMVQFFSLR